jgi:hypothetical protein
MKKENLHKEGVLAAKTWLTHLTLFLVIAIGLSGCDIFE